MPTLINPPGRAAVPDGRGGIRFVEHSAAPDGVPWGGHHHASDQGLPCVAYGACPLAGATMFDRIEDDRYARKVVGVGARKPLVENAPVSRLAAYEKARRAEAANSGPAPFRARLAPTNLQLQAGDGGISAAQGGGGGSSPAESGDESWAASRERVFGAAKR